MARTNKKTFLIAGISALMTAFVVGPHAAGAAGAGFADSPCDYDGYFESLKSRAWMEAQREMTQNQHLIQKPDSVLQYSCFDGFERDLAIQASNMFSESGRWGAVDTSSMDTALSGAVDTALVEYLGKNFTNKLVGETITDPTPYRLELPASSAYNCETMNAVWQKAQCANFNSTETSGFFTFDDYVSGDEKFNTCANPDLTNEWTDAQRIALVEPPWLNDPAKAYIADLSADDCAASTPISTGVTVNRPKDEPREYEEKICIKPGCNYNAAAGKCQEN